MEEIKFWKGYCIDWKIAEEKITMEQVREKIKKNGSEDFIGGGKSKVKTSDTFPPERKNQCGHRRDDRSKVLKVNVNFVVGVFSELVLLLTVHILQCPLAEDSFCVNCCLTFILFLQVLIFDLL